MLQGDTECFDYKPLSPQVESQRLAPKNVEITIILQITYNISTIKKLKQFLQYLNNNLQNKSNITMV